MEEGTPKLPVVGDVIGGKYRVDRVIGRGGMGTVLAVRHLGLDEARALKLMLPRGMELPQARERFFREARAAAKLRSEHAVSVHDVGVLPDGFPYIEMELLEGTDLAQLLKRSGPVPIESAASWIAQACEPVHEAHGLGIVHRDIKPGNLFLARGASGRDTIKVLDFGIAKTVGADTDPTLTGTHASFGSPMYMSPEQMRGARYAEPRSDVWALGVVLFELLTGRRPFVSESITALALVVTSEPAPHPASLRPDIPAAIDAIVMRCLEKAPDRRYGSAAELAAALSTAIGQAPAPSIRASLASLGGVGGPPSQLPALGAPVVPPASPSQPSQPSQSGVQRGHHAAPHAAAGFLGGPTTSSSQPSVATLSTTIGNRGGARPVLLVGSALGALVVGLGIAFLAWRVVGEPPRSGASATPQSASAPAPPTPVAPVEPTPVEPSPAASTEVAPAPPEASAAPRAPSATPVARGPASPSVATSAPKPPSGTGAPRPGRPPDKPRSGFGGID